MKKINVSWLLPIILVGISLIIGIFLVKNIVTKPQPKENEVISTEELKSKIDAKTPFKLIDARSKDRYELEHLPNAINIPENELDKIKNVALPTEYLVVYCEGFGCPSAKEAKNVLAKKGYKNVRIYNEGIPGWKADGNSTVKGSGTTIKNLASRYKTLPLVLLAGLTDGFNPCAIGMLLFLLGYLIIFAEKPEMSLKLGIAYIATTFMAYYLLGLVLLNSLYVITGSSGFQAISRSVNYVIIGVLTIAAIVNIKDVFFYGKGLSLQIPKKVRGQLEKVVEIATLPSTIVLAFLVTFFESPCSLPVYIGTLKILHETYSATVTLFYLALYNLMFVMPIIVLLVAVLKGEQMVKIKEWEHRNKKNMKLTMALMQLFIAAIIYFY
ncbi:MAG: Cytochrome c biogenesis protein, transmembrane region [candidate division CPR2 bacterium GW2011_GWC1_39_9]|uniref:Cytochrome c biogenesis protein, transmembrane region n=1 Tax=candidate division CPR2 bacterium GW2011_GWC2_39_10 TaxID=1618345 RepID=A0A0G0LSB5_UNCC2|nr:MAG: Cytochrome c biogenesis protein, transmembrane region [candidate division CPR2 bacterium GW2011_GWC2_39_10]KKR34142.1 MAG: Cytochrome c biogenesis protein, transmembrane region [candidate division CPR2 bacterium GW2011_GWC1_39_9]